MTRPSLTVVVSRTSGECRLLEALDSLRSQTFTDFEILIAERNSAIRQSKGEYISFLDSANLWMPHKLEKQMKKLRSHSLLNWCYCSASGADTSGNPQLRSGNILLPLLMNNFIPSSSVIIRKSMLDEIGLFDESETHASSAEWDMWLRIAGGHPVGLVAEPLVHVRTKDRATEQLFDSRKRVADAAIQRHLDSLNSLRSAAMAEICVSAGIAYLLEDKRSEARDQFAEALTHDPLRRDAYMSWISSFLPAESQQQVRDLANLGQRTQRSETAVREYSAR